MPPRSRRWSRRGSRVPDIALAATLHDPTGALGPDLDRSIARLQSLYVGIAVTTSPPTSARMVAALRDLGVYAGTPPSNTRGPLYRMAVRGALRHPASAVHYLDFDRALHWCRVAPRELAAVLRLTRRHPRLVIGRTPRAHASHHRPLWATETVANRIMADHLGVTGRFDVLVPSFVLERKVARALVARSRANDEGLYGEWAALVAGLAPALAYVECRGLDWETPDRFRRAVRRIGLPAWRRRQETPREWALRIELADAVVRRFVRTLARRSARPVLVRLPPRGVR